MSPVDTTTETRITYSNLIIWYAQNAGLIKSKVSKSRVITPSGKATIIILSTVPLFCFICVFPCCRPL